MNQPPTVSDPELAAARAQTPTAPPLEEIVDSDSATLIELHPSGPLLETCSSGCLILEAQGSAKEFDSDSREKIEIQVLSSSTLTSAPGVSNLLSSEENVQLKYPRPNAACFVKCENINPCCEPAVKPGDPEYLQPSDLQPNCQGSRKPLPSFEDNIRKKAYIKDVLLNPDAYESRSTKTREDWEKQQYFEQHPETTASLEFLKTHKEFQVSGRSQIRIPNDQLQNALNGYTNMHLAHEIAVNNDFRLEVYTPPAEGLEQRVRNQMTKAYWDIFDEAISSHNPNPAYALTVFREMKQMLLGLLLPHNRQIRVKIESFLDEATIQYEIDHDILEFPKYTDFIINIIGQLCCPMRDRQIADLKELSKPSDVFKNVMHVMEQMQLDMANFLICQIRPTIISNCVTYERKKFAEHIEVQYKLNQDPLRITRPWVLRHKMTDRQPIIAIGRAYAELFTWAEDDWPETLTLDWPRFVGLIEETKRTTFLGAAVLSAFNSAKPIFGDDEEQSAQPVDHVNVKALRCFPLREALRVDLNLVIQKEDCANQEKLKNVMDLLAEQAVKVCNDFVKKTLSRNVTSDEKELIRRSVRDCSRENHPVRNLLLRRIQEFATSVIAAGRVDSVDFPKGLKAIEEQVMRIVVEFIRLVMHNRAVFQELYYGILHGEVLEPKFMDENSEQIDASILKAIHLLNSESQKLVMTKRGINEKLKSDLDDTGRLLPQKEDLPYSETTPEIEQMIDDIIREADIQDDYDEFENISEEEATKLLKELQRTDSAAVRKQMKKEDSAEERIEAKKQKLREELRAQLKQEMGLPLFAKDKETRTSPGLIRYCRLLRAYDTEKKNQKKNGQIETNKPKNGQTKPNNAGPSAHPTSSNHKHAHFDHDNN